MKQLSKLVFAFILIGMVFAVVPSSKTNLPVMKAGKSLYGEDNLQNGIQLIGVNSAGTRVNIDTNGKGIIFGAEGSTQVTPSFYIVTRSATITTGNISIPVKIGTVTYYLKAHTSI